VVPTQDDVLPLQEEKEKEKKAFAPAVDLAEAMRQENPVIAPDRLPPSAPGPLVQPPSVPASSTVQQVMGLIQPTALNVDDLDDDDDDDDDDEL
jgi:hypothetical protein